MVIAILGLLTIAFQSRYIQTKVISFVTTNVSNKTGTDVSIERVKIRWFNKVILDNVYLGDLQNDTLFHAQQLTARLDSVLIFKKKLHFSNLAIDEPFINIYKADSGRYNFNFLIEAFTSDTIKQAEPEWRFFCNRFEIKHGHVDFSDSLLSAELLSLFNPDDINLTLDNIGSV